MVSGRFEYSANTKKSVTIPSRFKAESRRRVISIPRVAKYDTYPLSEGKKLAICNLLVRMRSMASDQSSTRATRISKA